MAGRKELLTPQTSISKQCSKKKDASRLVVGMEDELRADIRFGTVSSL